MLNQFFREKYACKHKEEWKSSNKFSKNLRKPCKYEVAFVDLDGSIFHLKHPVCALTGDT